jgi:hypothetical protein
MTIVRYCDPLGCDKGKIDIDIDVEGWESKVPAGWIPTYEVDTQLFTSWTFWLIAAILALVFLVMSGKTK